MVPRELSLNYTANILTWSENVGFRGHLLSILHPDAVMLLSLNEERRRNGESQSSNFVEIFKGSNLVGPEIKAAPHTSVVS